MNLNTYVDNYKEDIICKTQELIKIKSVEEEPKKGMPFGEGPYRALEYVLELSETLGLKTLNVDGYAGHTEYGQGNETVGVLVHLDVVPEGEGWTYPPYGGEIHDGKIYGRGIVDDKGPAIAAIYALKALKDSGVSLSKKIRIIFGTNEETGWGGIKYYIDKIGVPDMAFTPDAEYPVIHGEKGILIFDIVKKLENESNGDIIIEDIIGGNAPNMVPDAAKAKIKVSEYGKKEVVEKFNTFVEKTGHQMELTEDEIGQSVTILSKGVSAHGSMPQLGKNAISILLSFLGQLNKINGDWANFIKDYNEKIGMEYYGQSIGCGFEDDISGKLVFNVGKINAAKDSVKISVNIRYPIEIDSKDVYDGIKKSLEDSNIKLVEKSHQSPIYIPKDDILVQKLMKVYREITGDEESDAITIGGGTYARAMDNAVAFGPAFPGNEDVAHQKDEYMSIDDLIKNAQIYTKALYELSK